MEKIKNKRMQILQDYIEVLNGYFQMMKEAEDVEDYETCLQFMYLVEEADKYYMIELKAYSADSKYSELNNKDILNRIKGIAFEKIFDRKLDV